MKTATKERGIMFSAPMIRALLDGRKTQTRRIDAKRLGDNTVAVEPVPDLPGVFFVTYHYPDGREGVFVETVKCPYGQPGDRLWVREAFTLTQHGKPVYRADARDKDGVRWDSIEPGDPRGEVKWTPSLFMPRWASRITLEITDVRIERVQDISEEDCYAEGIKWRANPEGVDDGHDPWREYAELWDSINGKTHPWASNPFVRALTFKRVEALEAEAAKETN